MNIKGWTGCDLMRSHERAKVVGLRDYKSIKRYEYGLYIEGILNAQKVIDLGMNSDYDCDAWMRWLDEILPTIDKEIEPDWSFPTFESLRGRVIIGDFNINRGSYDHWSLRWDVSGEENTEKTKLNGCIAKYQYRNKVFKNEKMYRNNKKKYKYHRW